MKYLFAREYSIRVCLGRGLGELRYGLGLCRGHKEYCV